MIIPLDHDPAIGLEGAVSWYRIDFTKGQLIRGAESEVQACFWRAFVQAGKPRNMALFSRLPDQPAPRRRLEFYISPDGAARLETLLKETGATPCGKPDPVTAQLIVGHRNAARRLLK